MIPAPTLAKLEALRQRQRDRAERDLAFARAAHLRFEQQRRAWRDRLGGEAEAAGDDLRPLGRWLEASHARERATAVQAAQMKQAVSQAEAAYHAADRALEQARSLQQQARAAARRAALVEDQRRLDDLRPRPPLDGGDAC